jgi:mono/diheme cytochrome c family protein
MLQIHFKSFLFISLLAIAACQPNPYRDGAVGYKKACGNCHMENGEGFNNLVPPLAQSDFLKTNREHLPCILKNGIEDTIVVNGKTYSEKMWGIAKINDVEITNILNYVNHSWGNDNGVYKLKEVQEMLEKCGPAPQ